MASACSQVSADAVTDPAVAEICAGDDAARAPVVPFDSAARTSSWRTAAEHYRRAATLSSKVTTKAVALNALATLYDTALDDVNQLDATLRDLLSLKPDDPTPMYWLARAQEYHGMLDAAENTLLQARRQNPDAAEPYAALSAFYQRQANARRNAAAGLPAPAAANAKHIYRVGGDVRPPQKLVDVQPLYPADALAAGTRGVVILQVTVDEAGEVRDAKVVRSIPVFDQPALDAVRQWRFAPTTINGQTVPVTMTVTVNFMPKTSDAPPPSVR